MLPQKITSRSLLCGNSDSPGYCLVGENRDSTFITLNLFFLKRWPHPVGREVSWSWGSGALISHTASALVRIPAWEHRAASHVGNNPSLKAKLPVFG